jgi:hypothetical protein
VGRNRQSYTGQYLGKVLATQAGRHRPASREKMTQSA